MRMSKLVGRTIKETPRGAESPSHIFLIRGGYARSVSAGIYSLLPLARRITRKIESIIKDEMDRVDGQEVKMPVVLPRELWEESGRYQGVDSTLLRFKDRNDKDMLLGMTHEEAVMHLIRNEVSSYKQLPCMLYQIQTKYRDEARPRAGLIRVREFTMKDGYSFHTSDSCLKSYYERVHEAYVRIFKRLGMNDVLSIESDTGMMGGALAHEFMAVADCGEDTLFVSENGEYQANREVAVSKIEFVKESSQELEKVHTPKSKTIAEVASFLGVKESETGKAVFYSDKNNNLVFVVIRGDFEVNEIKLGNHLKEGQLSFANDEQIKSVGAVPGYASPLNIDGSKVRIVVDPSVAESSNLVVGANEEDYHYKNFNFERDMASLKDQIEVVDIATVREGDPDPVSGKPLIKKRGIEVGNIFQLGTKYSEAMNGKFLDENGKSHAMIMGCYGIGVERSMASVIEQNHDDYGPIWPLSIAPYHVHICALNYSKPEVKEASDKLYCELVEAGVEVLFDDRNEKAGSMFNDADLIGIPFRVVISPKTVKESELEFKTRDGSKKERLKLDETAAYLQTEIRTALGQIN